MTLRPLRLAWVSAGYWPSPRVRILRLTTSHSPTGERSAAIFVARLGSLAEFQSFGYNMRWSYMCLAFFLFSIRERIGNPSRIQGGKGYGRSSSVNYSMFI